MTEKTPYEELDTRVVKSPDSDLSASLAGTHIGRVNADTGLGRYIVLKLIGSGAMGAVYSGFDVELDRKVALKVLRQSFAKHQRVRARMLREAQALAQLSHPNVVQVYDVDVIDEQVFLAMEFVEGSTLGEWLDAEPRGWRECLDCYLQAGRGLAAAHEVGLVHRDLKPANILRGADGRVCVADFGLVQRSAHEPRESGEELISVSESQASQSLTLTQTNVRIGTPAYMSPEQHRGDPTDIHSDQFSFCICLWEALYGQRPFAGQSVPEIRKNVLAGTLHPLPGDTDVPARLHDLLVRGLANEPKNRWPSMDELLSALSWKPIDTRLHTYRSPPTNGANEAEFLNRQYKRTAPVLSGAYFAGSILMLTFTGWDALVDASSLAWTIPIRCCGALLLFVLHRIVRTEAGARWVPFALYLGVSGGMLAVILALLMMTDGLLRGTAGLMFFAILGFIGAPTARHMAVCSLLTIAAMDGAMLAFQIDLSLLLNTNIFIVSGGVCAIISTYLIESKDRLNFALETALEREARTDALTGIFNRSYFFARAVADCEQACATEEPLCMILVELDDFDRTGEIYGYAASDALAIETTTSCREAVGDAGYVGRMSDGKFAILVHTPRADAIDRANRLAARLDTDVATAHARVELSASLSVASLRAMESFDTFFRRADSCLHIARHRHEDRLVTARRQTAHRTSTARFTRAPGLVSATRRAHPKVHWTVACEPLTCDDRRRRVSTCEQSDPPQPCPAGERHTSTHNRRIGAPPTGLRNRRARPQKP